MDKITFGIPTKRVVHRVTLDYAAFIIQEAPVEKGKAFKMQLSDPAIELMEINLDVKSSIAIASLGDNVFLLPVTDEVREKIPEKDICMVYADGSLSNKRLYMYISKLFNLDNSIKNTFIVERATINSGIPGVEPVIMFKLLRASSHDTGQVTQQTPADTAEELSGDTQQRSEPFAEHPVSDAAERSRREVAPDVSQEPVSSSSGQDQDSIRASQDTGNDL